MAPQDEIETRELDNDGFLQDMSTGSRDLAIELGKRNDIPPLLEDHWRVIEYVRDYYLEHGIGPPIVKIGKDTGLSANQICTLFPCLTTAIAPRDELVLVWS